MDLPGLRITSTTFKDDPGWRFRKIDLDQTSRSVNFIGEYDRNHVYLAMEVENRF